MSSVHHIRHIARLKHVAPNCDAAIESGALYYRDEARSCSECGGKIKRLADERCVCQPIQAKPLYGR